MHPPGCFWSPPPWNPASFPSPPPEGARRPQRAPAHSTRGLSRNPCVVSGTDLHTSKHSAHLSCVGRNGILFTRFSAVCLGSQKCTRFPHPHPGGPLGPVHRHSWSTRPAALPHLLSDTVLLRGQDNHGPVWPPGWRRHQGPPQGGARELLPTSSSDSFLHCPQCFLSAVICISITQEVE